MAETKINITEVIKASSCGNAAKNTVSSAASGIRSTRNGIDSKILNRNNIAARLSSVENQVSQLARDIGSITSSISNGACQYQNTENQVISMARAVGLIENMHGNSSLSEYWEIREKIGKPPIIEEKSTQQTKEKNWNWWDLLWDEAENLGCIGTMTAGFGSIATKGAGADTLLGFVKKFGSVFGDAAEEAYKPGNEISIKKLLFGDWEKGAALSALKIPADSSKGAVWGAAFKKELFTDFSFKNAETVGEKIKVGTKWGGLALSAIGNGIDNYEEFGTIKSGRFWAETVTETAVDVLIGAAATAGATALLGATAPAVVVGGIAAGVVWVADGITKAITHGEKGLTEVVSDAILDTGEAIIKGGKKAISYIKNGVSNLKNNIGVKWKPLFG